MRFFKKVWKLLVGIKDGLVLIFMLLFFGLLYAVLSATPYAGSVDEGALVLDLRGSIVEQPQEADPLELLSDSSLVREFRLRDVVHSLRTAATDDRVKAVALDLDMFMGGGQAALSEVAEALSDVRQAGKPVIAYATGYSDDGYQLAAQASEVWLNPLGAVLITGRGGSNLYYKGLLDKIGVTANVYKAGTYKSAVEPFIRNDMSPEARENSEALAGALWARWLDEVKRARPKAQIDAYVRAPVDAIAQTNGDMANAAVRAGLVDKLGDRSAFERRLAEIAGPDETMPGSYKGIEYDAWVAANPAYDSGGDIGVVTVAGEIVDGTGGLGTAASETVVEYLEKGLKERDLKALIVRIDSPGGSTLASERIRRAVLEAKADGLPVVVSMGSVAASGGYWVATAGDRIFAQPETITGSIGVFGILPSFQGTMAKLGIGADGVKTTPLSGEPDLLRGPSADTNRLFQMGVDNTYRTFLGLVSKARKLPVHQVDRIAQGRVWDGGTARQLGLVDAYGTFDDAVAEAARRANIDPEAATLVYLEKEPDLWERMFTSAAGPDDGHSSDLFTRMAAEPQWLMMRALHDAQRMLQGSAIQARCLECAPDALPLRAAERHSVATWLVELFSA